MVITKKTNLMGSNWWRDSYRCGYESESNWMRLSSVGHVRFQYTGNVNWNQLKWGLYLEEEKVV